MRMLMKRKSRMATRMGSQATQIKMPTLPILLTLPTPIRKKKTEN